ncbi:MAG: glycosyltransferase family 2 protein [Bacteroidia bacterium]
MWQIAFWIVFAIIVFHYVGFSLLVILMSYIFKKRHQVSDIQPSVTFIVTAYNEEKVIGQKILNDLEFNYPKDKFEFIVVSDGSTDTTPEIVESFKDQGVISLFQPLRQGKTAALNRALEAAKNDIVIFSDANSMFRPDAVSKLVRHFADDSIGGVCGRKSVLQNAERRASLGDSIYWHYESSLKQAESALGSIPTADGEIFALRKNLFKPVPPELINDDLIITLNIIGQGKRVISDQEAITEEEASINLKDDFNVKSRMVYGGIQAIILYKKFLNPLKSWFGFQFFVHKILRYFMWFFLAAILLLNLGCLSSNIFYQMFFTLQTAFYLMAFLGYTLEKRKANSGVFYFPYYYCNVNFAAIKGFIFFLRKRSTVEIWKKAER